MGRLPGLLLCALLDEAKSCANALRWHKIPSSSGGLCGVKNAVEKWTFFEITLRHY